MYYLFIISILFILFLSSSFATYLGIANTVTFAYTPFLCYFVAKHPKISKNSLTRWMFGVVIFAAFAYVFRLLGLGQDYFKNYLTFLVFPMLISIDLESEDSKRLSVLRKCLILFFIVECLVAVYEKITETCLFYDPTAALTKSQLEYYVAPEEWEFRSYAFFAHPLMNAMIVCVVLSFMLISDMRMKYKLLLFMLGYTSLWCFNARGATIVTSVLMIPYLLLSLYRLKIRNKKWIYLILITFAFGFVWLVFTTSLGGRLLVGDELMDGSAQTRVDVFSFYQFLKPIQLWFGSPDLYLFVMYKLQAGGVENGVITMILREGIIFTALILMLLFHIQRRQIAILGKYSRWWLLAIFYIIGTMNPNLSSALPWTFWILSYYAFIDKNISSVK